MKSRNLKEEKKNLSSFARASWERALPACVSSHKILKTKSKITERWGARMHFSDREITFCLSQCLTWMTGKMHYFHLETSVRPISAEKSMTRLCFPPQRLTTRKQNKCIVAVGWFMQHASDSSRLYNDIKLHRLNFFFPPKVLLLLSFSLSPGGLVFSLFHSMFIIIGLNSGPQGSSDLIKTVLVLMNVYFFCI